MELPRSGHTNSFKPFPAQVSLHLNQKCQSTTKHLGRLQRNHKPSWKWRATSSLLPGRNNVLCCSLSKSVLSLDLPSTWLWAALKGAWNTPQKGPWGHRTVKLIVFYVYFHLCWWQTHLPALAEQHQHCSGCPVAHLPFVTLLWVSLLQGRAEGLQDRPCAGHGCALLVRAQQWQRLHRRPLQGLPGPTPLQLHEETLSAAVRLKISLCAPSCPNDSSEQQLSACHTGVTAGDPATVCFVLSVFQSHVNSLLCWEMKSVIKWHAGLEEVSSSFCYLLACKFY